MKLIAKNAGVNGSVVTEKVLSSDNMKYGYNAATGKYEDLMAAGIIDPTKVVRCCLEHAASVASAAEDAGEVGGGNSGLAEEEGEGYGEGGG